MIKHRSLSWVTVTLQCCTCDGEEGPRAVLKIIFVCVQDQNATLEPALILQRQPLQQQRGSLSQRDSAYGREGGREEENGSGKRGELQTETHRQVEPTNEEKCSSTEKKEKGEWEHLNVKRSKAPMMTSGRKVQFTFMTSEQMHCSMSHLFVLIK